ncbi:hypothetical protein DMENIID0001_126430 [Sergentomyia squamirostris]
MSLTVRINQFHVSRLKSNLIGRVEFRGVSHTTNDLDNASEIINVNQAFVWPLARSSTPEEPVVIELRAQTTKILSKAGLSTSSSTSTSATRRIIRSNAKVIGRYVMLMQGVMTEGKVRVEDHLVDLNNKTIQAIVNFEVAYISPDDEAGNFEPSNLVNVIQSNSTSLEDDQQMLLDIEQNIANLEKSLSKDTGHTSKRQHFLKRVMSQGKAEKVFSSVKSAKQLQTSDKQKVSLRAVKNFMKLGKQRRASRESSTEDERRSLISDAEGGLNSTTDQYTHHQHDDTVDSESQQDMQSEDSSDDDDKFQNEIKNKRFRSLGKPNDHLKAQDFQVCVTIIEARQLPGLNMDPVVCIQVGDIKKYTSVKESTNCPYYNEYFVFDFHMAPVMLFDKIITLSVLQSHNVLRPNKLIGSVKLDISTVWNQKNHQFYHKWALLTDPEDFISGPKGYLKCDIGIIGKGDTVKVPQKSEKDPDDIEANLLLPDGVPIDRQRARFIVRIYRADGLPRMNSSLMANVKRAFTGESKDLVNPYVHVSFAGLSGKTSVKKNSYTPVWNEQLVFTEMFPPLCQRIKVQLRDADPVKPSIIGTHYIDLKHISNDGEKGFLPTFGPSFIHLYGSTRDYTLLDQHSTLNTGLGEGVSYRARLLIAIRTEITDNIEIISEKNVELEQTFPISESSYSKCEEFFLFATVMEASMLDRKLSDKQVLFELSIGNSGNSLDGHNESTCTVNTDDEDLEVVDSTAFNSTTNTYKPTSHDKVHYFLPYWDYKPCMDVRCVFPDLRRRMYNSNMIGKMADKLEESLSETNVLIENEDTLSEVNIILFIFPKRQLNFS